MAINKDKLIRRSIKWGAGILAWSMIGIGAWGGAGTPFYRVKQEYARVLTEIDGDRRIEADVGIHCRITSLSPSNWIVSTKEFSKRVEYIHLDKNPYPHEMQAADKIKFQGAGVWTYKITDLEKFGIKMGAKALEMLTVELNGIAKAKVQSHDVEYIVTKIDKINEEINQCIDIRALEEKYGVDIISFRLTHATYPKEMNEKTAEAKGIKIKAEAVKEAADSIASAKKTIADANRIQLEKLIEGSGVKTEEGRKKALDVVDRLNLYDVLKERPPGENTYIFSEGDNTPNLTLPSKGEGKTNLRNQEGTQKEKGYEPYKRDPETGHFIDPDTGYLIDPFSGLLTDPNSGLLIDPATGQPIDPATNELTDPDLI